MGRLSSSFGQAVLALVSPQVAQQRCGAHKLRHIADQVPNKEGSRVREAAAIYQAACAAALEDFDGAIDERDGGGGDAGNRPLLALREVHARLCYHPLMEAYTYPITVRKEGRKYYAYSEDFPGVYGLGKTIEEAKASILEAMRLYIRECRARRRPVPRARTIYSETVSIAV